MLGQDVIFYVTSITKEPNMFLIQGQGHSDNSRTAPKLNVNLGMHREARGKESHSLELYYEKKYV